MRIALVSPLLERVPPTAYGGTERVVATLANCLSAQGHEVTLFATSDSCVNATLVGCRDRGMLTDERRHDRMPDHILMMDEVRRRERSFDMIHFHTEFLHFPMFRNLAHKTLTTCHMRMDREGLPRFFNAYRQFPMVSISDAQRKPVPEANWVETIPHGYPADQYRAIPGVKGDRNGEYLAFLGRITPEKGIEQAIDIARQSGKRLKIAARINIQDRDYWEKRIAPRVDGGQIEYVGEIADHEKSEFLSRASAMLFPICWPEPFGLVLIEAMACGTPVIANRCGSVPEVIEEGRTGSIVDSTEQAVAAVGRLESFDRKAIRERFEQRYSAKAMTDRYVDLYRRVLASHRNEDMESHRTAAREHLRRLRKTRDANGHRPTDSPDRSRDSGAKPAQF